MAAAEPARQQEAAPLLVVEGLVKEYPRKGLSGGLGILWGGAPRSDAPQSFRAVDGISFTW